ncbi:hypothetical protein OG257_34210 [Streptomyces sp. NBC_00683]|uniref:hypothetical protein n=1 Tax=Streptomyces sp. NBC_00683 TaxID=2903670 RepID=UPI002E34F038|nr:hypothetical protein [Streptomyces sp. NBC_00683]
MHWAPSRIIPMYPEEEALHEPSVGIDMTMTAGIVDAPPLLILRTVMTPPTNADPHEAEPRNLFIQTVLQNGFRLVTAELDDAGPLQEWTAVAVFQPLEGRLLQPRLLLEVLTRPWSCSTAAHSRGRPPAESRPYSSTARSCCSPGTSQAARKTRQTNCVRRWPWPPPPAS